MALSKRLAQVASYCGRALVLLLALTLLLEACAGSSGSRPGRVGQTTQLPVLRRTDVSWLERTTFGLDSETVADYRRLGRARYLEEQLRPPEEVLPPTIAAQVRAITASEADAGQTLATLSARRKAIDLLADRAAKDQARKALNDDGNRAAYQAIRLQLLRAIYSPAQLR